MRAVACNESANVGSFVTERTRRVDEECHQGLYRFHSAEMFSIFFLDFLFFFVVQAMVSLNKQINLPELQATMAEFQKQSEVMGMKQEMMEDAMDELMDDDETEEEQERIVQSVLDEIGIQLNEQLVSAPSASSKVHCLLCFPCICVEVND